MSDAFAFSSASTSTSRAFDCFDPANVHSPTRRLFIEALYREHGPNLVDFAARRILDEDAAEDVVQEAFTSILSGHFPVPAVDVVRKLEIVVDHCCDEHLRLAAARRAGKLAARAARERPRERIWRSWRVTPVRARDRDSEPDDTPSS